MHGMYVFLPAVSSVISACLILFLSLTEADNDHVLQTIQAPMKAPAFD